MSVRASRALLLLMVLGVSASMAVAAEAVTPGELTVDPPTLICLGFHWALDGDDDGDAVCEIRFRKVGGERWRRGLDLWRTNGETCGTDGWTPPAWKTPNAFAGSLFDLEPDTAYEVQLKLVDPDGVSGEPARVVTVRTRPEPRPATGGKMFEMGPDDIRRVPVRQQAKVVATTPLPDTGGTVFNVVPPDADHSLRSRLDKSRRGLLHAFYGYRMYCDWAWSPDVIEPGETIVVQPGLYKSNRRDYRVSPGYSLWFHGTHFLGASGTKDRPIVIRAAEGGEVIFDGADCDTLFDVTHADWIVFEGITFRDCRIAIKAGDAVRGAKGLRLIDCNFENVELPVLAANARCTEYQISGNTVDGEPDDLIDPEQVVGYRDLIVPAEAGPGDVIKLKAGRYSVRREGDAPGGPWVGGSFVLTSSGTAEKPIAIVGDDEVIIDGAGCDTLFDVRGAHHVYFEGLTFRNAKITVKAGIQFLSGTTGLSVKRCRYEDVGYGVMGTSGQCRDFYIADNHMRCRQVKKIKGQVFDRDFGYGVNVLGMGHVACYNDISNFWDNLNVTTNGHGDPRFARPAISIDFYNNVVGRSGDNGGEADGSVRNVRFMRNKCTFTCQPLWGGPVYFIRNLGEPTKYAEHPSGVVALHNSMGTISAKGGKHSYLNNAVSWSWRPELFSINTDSDPGRVDGNAYCLVRGGKVARPDKWVLRTPSHTVEADSLAALREATGLERHGFVYETSDNSALVDKAILLPNVNDDYAGDGPDIGPHEQGKPEPHYGPRD